jgi:molecular chaperone HscB
VWNIVLGMTALPADYFAVFELPHTLTVDQAALQEKFYALSRRYHPDRYAARPASEQQHALDLTAMLNDAYRVLRDPVQRAEYLLKQEGFDIGEQRSKDVPPELLEEVFELNVMLEELREGDESSRPQLVAERDRFVGMLNDVDAELRQQAEMYGAGENRSVLAGIRGTLNRRRYIQNLIRDVEKALA